MKKAIFCMVLLALVASAGLAYAREDGLLPDVPGELLGQPMIGIVTGWESPYFHNSPYLAGLPLDDEGAVIIPEPPLRMVYVEYSDVADGLWLALPEDAPDAPDLWGKGVRFTLDEASVRDDTFLVTPAELVLAGDTFYGRVTEWADDSIAVADFNDSTNVRRFTVTEATFFVGDNGEGRTCEIVHDEDENALLVYQING